MNFETMIQTSADYADHADTCRYDPANQLKLFTGPGLRDISKSLRLSAKSAVPNAVSRIKRLGWLAGLLLIGSLPVAGAPVDGDRVFVCGHSFHFFIGQPLEALAHEAGHAGHKTAGTLVLGSSRVIDIWNLPDAKNTAKAALQTGGVDVLTLSPHKVLPDPGIDLYADLAVKYNPNAHVFVQFSWSQAMMEKPDTAYWRKLGADYAARLQKQVEEINARQGRATVSIVPVAPAVLALWDLVEAGKVPGVDKVGSLFVDNALHPSPVLKNLIAYCWFASIYKQSPVGLKALDGQVPAATNRILEQLAWETVTGFAKG
ncbi:MAG TPA: hypothetical protein VK968_18180 [Roseimicrobium sp.]|nr:hypothetical protein [Roseimicrobium sp.]